MPSETLQFEDARELNALFGGDPKNLKFLEQTLGVKTVTREGWLRVEGSAPAIEKTRAVFDELKAARCRGVQIRRHEFHSAIAAIIRGQRNQLQGFFAQRITVSPRKRMVSPRTFGQNQYVEAIRDNDIVFGIGPAGTGKTYLAMAMAVSELREEKVGRIILCRPAVEAGEALGFLPGTLDEKVAPYLRPLHDALHDMLDADEIARLTERGIIEVAPLAYMRGRTLNHSFVILDEAQNATSEQMFMFLTRLGFDSKCVVTGDVTQVDLPAHKRSGLIEAEELLKDIVGIAVVRLNESDVVRHELVQKIIAVYQGARSKRPRVSAAK